MFRVALFFAAAFALIALVSSAPVALDSPSTELEKRITHTGRGTWFEVGLGHCGNWNVDSDPIVAIPESLYDQNGGSNCGQWIEITDTNTGKVVYAVTADSCPGCDSGSLDMSPGIFQQFASLSTGVIPISWHFMARGWTP